MRVRTVTSFWGDYGFRDVYADYAVFVHSLRESTKALPRVTGLKPFSRAELRTLLADVVRESGPQPVVRDSGSWPADILPGT